MPVISLLTINLSLQVNFSTVYNVNKQLYIRQTKKVNFGMFWFKMLMYQNRDRYFTSKFVNKANNFLHYLEQSQM